ncbi:MAG: sugar ABC transporter permease, partial [Anaerolineae bacterium]|nr:sugar ABC transporter permease [Anaerolineae bacterium]
RGWRLPKDTPLAVTLLFPVVFIMGLVIIYPLARGFYLSLLNWRLIDPAGPSYAGLSNYRILAKDPVFYQAFRNTMVFSGVSVASGFILGLILALLLNANIKFPRFFRGVALVPWIVPYIVVAFLFQLMFNFDVGIINYLLQKLGFAPGFLPWLATPNLAMAAVIIANVWNQTPFYMLMFLAGLQSIPSELIEAAIIDGANPLQLFWNIIVPHLQNIMVITTILMLIRNFNNFPLIYTMTGGGPVYATTTLPIYIYRLAFSDFKVGYAATVGIVWLLFLILFTTLYVRRFEREVAL